MEYYLTTQSARVLGYPFANLIRGVAPLALLVLWLNASRPTFADDPTDSIRLKLKSGKFQEVDACIYGLTSEQVLDLAPDLCDLVDGSQPLLAWSAIRRLSQLKPADLELQQRMISVFIKQLSHDEHAYRKLAIEGLLKVGEPSVQPLLKELNQSRSVSKSAAAYALARLKSLPIGRALQLSHDSDPRVRFAAIQAMDNSPESMAALCRLLTDSELAVAVTAADFVSLKLKEPTNEIIQTLVDGLSRDDFKRHATLSLARMGSLAQHTIPQIIRSNAASEHFQFGKRWNNNHWISFERPTETAIRHIGPPQLESLEDLIELLQDPREDVQAHASTAIGMLGLEAKAAASALIQALEWHLANPLPTAVASRAKLLQALWLVTEDVSAIKTFIDRGDGFFWSMESTAAKKLFIQLATVESSNPKSLSIAMNSLIKSLRADDQLVQFLENKLYSLQNDNREVYANAFLRVVQTPTASQLEILQTNSLLDAGYIARKLGPQVQFRSDELRQQLGRKLDTLDKSLDVFGMTRGGPRPEIAIAWVSLAEDRAKAMEELLSMPNVDDSAKAAAIAAFEFYNDHTFRFLKEAMHSPESQYSAIRAIGLAGIAAQPLRNDLIEILNAAKDRWRKEQISLEESQLHYSALERAIRLALLRIQPDEKSIVELVTGCQIEDTFDLQLLLHIVREPDIDLGPVQSMVFDALDQAVQEFEAKLDGATGSIYYLSQAALRADPELAFKMLQELARHRQPKIRSIAQLQLDKLTKPKDVQK